MTLTPNKEDGLQSEHRGTLVAIGPLVIALVAAAVLLWPSPSRAGIVKRTDKLVGYTQGCERTADRDRSPTPSERRYARSHSRPFRNWAFILWRGRARRACAKVRYLNSDPRRAVSYVFARVEQQAKALSVVGCESNYYTGAVNGQYLGLFQMGSYARSRYGHGFTPLDQSWPAYFYYRDSGWSPWACA